MWLVCRRREIHVVFWLEYLKERDHLEDLSIEQRIILEWILEKWDEMVWTSLICLRVGEKWLVIANMVKRPWVP
jgi:hypothetical protein